MSGNECPHKCRVVLAEIVTNLMTEYELGRSGYGVRHKSANAT